MADDAQENTFATTPTDVGMVLGVLAGVVVGVPLYFVIGLGFLRVTHAVPRVFVAVAAFVPFILAVSLGSWFINRRRFVFLKDSHCVEVTTSWFFLRGRTQVLPFSQIRVLELRWNGEGPCTLEMFTWDGRRLTVKRQGSMKRLRALAEGVAKVLGKATVDKIHWR